MPAHGALSRDRGGWQVFLTQVVFYYKRFVRVIRNLYGIFLLIEAQQQQHCCLYDPQKCLEILTASLVGRQPPIQPIFSLAAWGGTAHAGDALPARCAPSSAREGVASVSIWSDNLQKKL